MNNLTAVNCITIIIYKANEHRLKRTQDIHNHQLDEP